MSLPSRANMISELKLHLESVQGKAIKAITVANGEMTVLANRDSIVQLLAFLRDDSQCRFETLVDLCGCDYPTVVERFEVVYHML